MEEILNLTVRELVGSDHYEIETKESDKRVDFIVRVDTDTFGRVIGRNGETASVIRSLIRDIGRNQDPEKRYYIEFVER